MNILLLGANGQVGRELLQVLPTIGKIISCGRDQLDFSDLDKLKAFIQKLAPDVIVNAAAYTAVDKAESEPDLAFRINAEAVAVIAGEAKRLDALLVHYSTDYIFDGLKTDFYTEMDEACPKNAYGKSKWQGEEAIKKSNCRYIIFRTSWVFGVDGNNFVKTILRLAKQRGSINVVDDQIGSPTSAALIADITGKAILAFQSGTMQRGVYHLASSGYTTWHGLACFILDTLERSGSALTLKSSQVRAIPTSEYPTPAKRPANSRLDTALLQQSLGITLPGWQEQVSSVVSALSNKTENE